MDKLKQDSVSTEMRARLLANRHGKLTSGQWWDIVTEPLVVLLLLVVPGVVVLRSVLISMLIGGFWVIGTAALVGVGIMVVIRARRYARMAVQFTILCGGKKARPAWMFWRGWLLYDKDDKPVRFAKSLAPSTRLEPGQAYMLYYLNDKDSLILLSIAPADHPNAESWKPSSVYEDRLVRRL
jgi:hypothetical protein